MKPSIPGVAALLGVAALSAAPYDMDMRRVPTKSKTARHRSAERKTAKNWMAKASRKKNRRTR